MLKNLASLGAAGAVRNSLITEIKPNPSRFLLETLNQPCRTIQQMNAPPESSSAPVNINSRRHFVGPSVGRYDTETQIRKFRFTGKYPRLTIAKNLSNPSLVQNDADELKTCRPLSCPQKTPSRYLRTTSQGNEYSDNEGRKAVKSNTLLERHMDLKPQRSSLLKSSPSTNKMEVSTEGARKMKSSAQGSSASEKETNTTHRTSAKIQEGHNSQSVYRSHNFKRRDSAFEKKSANNKEDPNKKLDTVNKKVILSNIENDFRITGNNSFSNRMTTEPVKIDAKEIATGVVRTDPNHNKRINNLTPSSVTERVESPKIQKKRNSPPTRSGKTASHSEVEQINDDRTYPKKNSQTILSETTKTGETLSNKQAQTLRQSSACYSISPLIAPKKVSFEGNISSLNIRVPEKQSWNPESRLNSAGILRKDQSLRKSDTPNSRSRSGVEGNIKLHPGEVNARKKNWNFDTKPTKKLDPSVLERFRNRQNTLNKIDFNSLPCHDFSFRSSFVTKKDWDKEVTKRPLSTGVSKPSTSSAGRFAALNVKSDVLEKPKETEDTNRVRTGTINAHTLTTEKLMPFKSAQKALMIFKGRSASRGRTQFASKSASRILASRKGNKLLNKESKTGGSSSGGSDAKNSASQPRGGPLTRKSVYRKGANPTQNEEGRRQHAASLTSSHGHRRTSPTEANRDQHRPGGPCRASWA